MLHPGSRTAASRRICGRGNGRLPHRRFHPCSTSRSGGRAKLVLQGDGQPGDGVDGHGHQAPSPVEPGHLRIAAQNHEDAARRECATQCGDGVVRVLEAWAPVTGYPSRQRACLRDGLLRRVDRIDLCAQVSEPTREPAGPTADVQGRTASPRHLAQQQTVIVVVVIKGHGPTLPQWTRTARRFHH
jgi:hypothetical protein